MRRGPGGRRPKVVAANVDRLVVVAAAARPEPRQVLLDRLLVVGEANDLDLALVMNKIDLEVRPLPRLFPRPLQEGRVSGSGDQRGYRVRALAL